MVRVLRAIAPGGSRPPQLGAVGVFGLHRRLRGVHDRRVVRPALLAASIVVGVVLHEAGHLRGVGGADGGADAERVRAVVPEHKSKRLVGVEQHLRAPLDLAAVVRVGDGHLLGDDTNQRRVINMACVAARPILVDGQHRQEAAGAKVRGERAQLWVEIVAQPRGQRLVDEVRIALGDNGVVIGDTKLITDAEERRGADRLEEGDDADAHNSHRNLLGRRVGGDEAKNCRKVRSDLWVELLQRSAEAEDEVGDHRRALLNVAAHRRGVVVEVEALGDADNNGGGEVTHTFGDRS